MFLYVTTLNKYINQSINQSINLSIYLYLSLERDGRALVINNFLNILKQDGCYNTRRK